MPQTPPQPQTLSLVSETPEPEAPLNNCAWLPWWDFQNAEAEFINSKAFEVMSPFIYSLNEELLIESKLPNTPEIFEDYKDDFDIIPTISNDFNPNTVSEILNNSTKLNKHIADINTLVIDNQYDGIDLDYEYLKAEDKDKFSDFVKLLSEKLHEADKELIVTVHAKTSDEGSWHGAEALDWKALSQYADKIRVMAYDFNSSESSPGPIAPLDWVQQVSDYAATRIPKEKAILALGLYGYEWKDNKPKATQLMLNDVEKLKEDLDEFEDTYDEDSQASKLVYDNNTIWYENAQSFGQKVSLAKQNFAGVCIWRLGDTPDELLKLLSE